MNLSFQRAAGWPKTFAKYMKTLITILSIVLLVPIANIRGETLEPKSEVKGEVLEFGLIESVGAEKAVPSPESAFGKAVTAPGARFIERTKIFQLIWGPLSLSSLRLRA